MTMKRILPMVLSFLLICCTLPNGVLAAEIANGKCGDNLTWTLDGNGLLTISGTGDMINGAAWELYMHKIETVVIENGVTSIGTHAFSNCIGLTNITIPDSVQSIGANAFSYCARLTAIELPDGLEILPVYTFSNCTALSNITLPDSLKSIECAAFERCASLKKLTIPAKVSSIGGKGYSSGAFSGCTSLEITVSDENPYYCVEDNVIFDKEKTTIVQFLKHNVSEYSIPNGVTVIAPCAFSLCEDLTYVTIPSSVQSIGEAAFNYCINLKSILLPDGIREIGFATFQQCRALESVNIPKSVTVIELFAFFGCRALDNIELPMGIERIGDSAFGSCSSLSRVTIPASVSDLGGGVFSECPILILTVSEDNPYYCVEGNVLYNKNKTALLQFLNLEATEYIVPETVSIIGDGAFQNCYGLQAITLPYGVTKIGYNAFSGTGITSIVIPDSVQSLGMFAFMSTNLTDIVLPYGIKEIGIYTFSFCSQLKSISMTGVVSIDCQAFEYCESLTDIELPEALTHIDDMAFSGCTSLKNITIPSSVTYMGASVFQGCSPDMVISGYINTAAYQYALDHSIRFNQLEQWIDGNATTKENDEGIREIVVELDPSQTDTAPLSSEAIILGMSINGSMQNISPADISSGKFTAPYEEGTAYIKIFNWESPESMIPLSEVLVLAVN